MEIRGSRTSESGLYHVYVFVHISKHLLPAPNRRRTPRVSNDTRDPNKKIVGHTGHTAAIPSTIKLDSEATSLFEELKKESLGAKKPITKMVTGMPMRYTHIYTLDSITVPLVV
jgi:hypothetical protein